ncbi:MAG: FG-GAP repeat protein, partial [Planctomycetia bacterium]
MTGQNDRGSAYVYYRNGTIWSEQAKLLGSGASGPSEFGGCVAISGASIAVGAYYDNYSGNTRRGSAFIFTRTGTSWTQQAQLAALDGAANDWFGSSLDLENDTLVVGAIQDDVNFTDQGSA